MTARPMTREEALAEARRRWGWATARLGRHDDGTLTVGRRTEAPGNWVLGSGPTWEAAFADADRREKEGGR